jgi:hypothetical protein
MEAVLLPRAARERGRPGGMGGESRQGATRQGSAVLLSVPYYPQETDDTCAPACLRMALAFRSPRRRVSEGWLARRCRVVKGLGPADLDVFDLAARLRLPARWLDDSRIEAEVEEAIRDGCPVMANVELAALPYYRHTPPPPLPHSVLVIGIDDEHVYVSDPDPALGGRDLRVTRRAFFATWQPGRQSAFRL